MFKPSLSTSRGVSWGQCCTTVLCYLLLSLHSHCHCRACLSYPGSWLEKKEAFGKLAFSNFMKDVLEESRIREVTGMQSHQSKSSQLEKKKGKHSHSQTSTEGIDDILQTLTKRGREGFCFCGADCHSPSLTLSQYDLELAGRDTLMGRFPSLCFFKYCPVCSIQYWRAGF